MQVMWFFPTAGDGRSLSPSTGRRKTDYAYLKQIAIAADTLGYYGALLPTGLDCEEAWVMASSFIPITKSLRFLVAARPAVTTPSVSAQMAATFDRASEGRLLVNVVTGSGRDALAREGIALDYDDRYPFTDEFLTIWRGLLRGDTVDFDGRFLKIQGARLKFAPIQAPYPPLYFGGSSDAALDVAAKHVDVYLTWGEPPTQAAKKVERVRALAAAQGRTLRFGIRLHVVVRETEQEAWDAANDLIKDVTDQEIAQAQQAMTARDAEGQRRMTALHGGRRDALEISPNLWAGIGLVRSGAGTALVGDPVAVAHRMREYVDIGIETFILSGYPHLEEAYRFAELVFPLLNLRH